MSDSDSDDERNATGSGQLRGLKVVEFAHVVAGPLAGSMLADQGADVVHVEPPAPETRPVPWGPSVMVFPCGSRS